MGGIIYLICRSGTPVYFLTYIFPEAVNSTGSAGYMCRSVPSFIHVYACILLIASVLNPSRAWLSLICFSWMIVELFFEIGQHPVFAQQLTEWVPLWFDGFPFLEVTKPYFLNGTFDPVDVLFIIIGTAAALLTLRKVQGWEVRHA